MSKKLRRSAGSRTATDVLRLGFRGPSTDMIAQVLAALRDGSLAVSPLRVSCFLRAEGVDLPERFTQGTLEIGGEVWWRPFWRRRMQALHVARGTIEGRAAGACACDGRYRHTGARC